MCWRGFTKLIFWDAKNIATDCFTNVGRINHRGIKIMEMNSKHIRKAIRFFFGNFLISLEYKGAKTNAKMIPLIIERKIGLKMKKDNKINTPSTIKDAILLKEDSFVMILIKRNVLRS